ncbi:MAG: NUDIX hydrolase [Calditrichaeota bacterium]|nr:MAG: NUDIX hydrolase [Calditrichota bacterium]
MTKSTVAAIITKVENGVKHVLLARRNTEPYKGYWSIPGGHVEQNETSFEAVIREIKEEIGLDFKPSYLWNFDEIIPNKKIHADVSIFHGKVSGITKLSKAEIIEIKWVPLAEAASENLAFLHNFVLEKYIRTIKKDQKTEMIAEYSSLRDEILKRMEFRNHILTFTLIVAGSVLSFGSTTGASVMVLLVYPILALFLAIAWMHSDVRAGEIGNYIKNHIESELAGIGWENFISNYKLQTKKNLLTKSTEISASGIFLVTGIVSLIIAIPKISLTYNNLLNSIQIILLLLIDVVAIIFTYFLLRRRRRKI